MVSDATIVRLRGATVDEYGDPTGTDTRSTLEGCFVAPATSSPADDRGRTGVVVGLTLFGPYSADLVRTDRVEVDGVTYRITGEVGPWKNPLSGWEAGFEVALERGDG